MSKYLYGACGNKGCLDCTPAFVVAFDGGKEITDEHRWEQYEADVTLERISA